MSINFYGMPMQPNSVGLSTLINMISDGTPGGEILFLDDEILEVIEARRGEQEQYYKEQSEKHANEMSIATPQDSPCKTGWDIFVAGLEGTIEAIVDFVGDVVGFAFDLANEVLGAGLAGLFSGPIGPILLIGGGVALFILLK